MNKKSFHRNCTFWLKLVCFAMSNNITLNENCLHFSHALKRRIDLQMHFCRSKHDETLFNPICAKVFFFSLKKKFSTFKREVCRTACAKEGLPCISRLCKFFFEKFKFAILELMKTCQTNIWWFNNLSQNPCRVTRPVLFWNHRIRFTVDWFESKRRNENVHFRF